MKPAPLFVYSVLRLLAFLVPLAILWFFFPIFREFWWLAAIFAALIGISISLLFLRRPLSEASATIYERRRERTTAGQEDAEAEDAVIDGDADARTDEVAVDEVSVDEAPGERRDDGRPRA